VQAHILKFSIGSSMVQVQLSKINVPIKWPLLWRWNL